MAGRSSDSPKTDPGGWIFGQRPRVPFRFHLARLPSISSIHKRLSSDSYYCVGVDQIDGVRWFRYEKRSGKLGQFIRTLRDDGTDGEERTTPYE